MDQEWKKERASKHRLFARIYEEDLPWQYEIYNQGWVDADPETDPDDMDEDNIVIRIKPGFE